MRSWPRSLKRRTTSINTTFIYVLNDPRTNQVRYVGKADDPLERWKDHCKTNPRCPHAANWIAELRQLGLKPELEILEEIPREGWQEIEKEYIRVFRMIGIRLTNISDGGDGITKGHVFGPMSPETKKKISVKALGNTRGSFNLGQKRTPEQCAKFAAAKLGTKQSPETIAKRVAKNTGQKRTPEQCERVSAGHRGRKESFETKEKIRNRQTDRKLSGSSSKFLGVSWDKAFGGCWRANITVESKQLRLGSYLSEVDAAITYDWVASLYGKKVNFSEKERAACSL